MIDRRDVLDKGYVELIDMMPHPLTGISGDLAIVNAARTSFLGESKGAEADKKLLFRLLRDQHTSPFEQVQFKWNIYAPLVTYWQWVRHRTFHFQSINSQSGRYTEFQEEFYTPDRNEWRLQSKSNKQASSGLLIDIDRDAAENLTNELMDVYEIAYANYQRALNLGVAREQARLFLPGFSVYYKWVVSANALNLMNFLKLRLADDAQYEIRVYAEAIYEMFKEQLPWTAEAFELYVLKDDDT